MSQLADHSFLGGRVRRFTLPSLNAPAPPEAPVIKRLLLPQGELAQFYDGEDPIRYIAAIELRAGSARGNHYHRFKTEWIYLVHGELLLALADTRSDAQDRLTMKTGDLVFIPTEIAHALQPVKDGLAVEFSSVRFDPVDTYRFSLLV